ncbi:hypothetical protein [Hoeflea sp.]|uniref:hypothetical protein n=1 Tax=Hoeflea sp. TaxID=1940281 RepID=UPI003A8CA860
MAAIAGMNIRMSFGRLLLLCLLTVTLGMTGPLTRALSSPMTALSQTMPVSIVTAAADLKTSTNPSKRCQRGAIVRSNCHFDTGYPASVQPQTHARAVSSLELRHADGTATPPATRIFRPPRSS